MNLPQTLDLYLLEELKDHPERLDLVMIMSNISTIARLISSRINRAGLTDLMGLTDNTNIHNETQAKLDVYANDLCKQYIKGTGLFAALASEEEDTAVDLETPSGKYVIAFDPLDGSDNIDVNVGVGTIFSVHKRLDNIPASDERQFLQAGRDQVLAGYILYGSSTMLVFSWGNGVHAFTLDFDLGEFLLSNAHVKLPAECPYYCINEAYVPYMAERDQEFLNYIKTKVAKQRWIASFVADFHRNLIKGGIFFFPPFDISGHRNFKPKLRLNYEVQPMAFLIEQAGGSATDGSAAILDIVPTSLHQRVALVIGNADIVNQYKENI